MKILSDEVEAIAKMVSYEYTAALGSMQKGEMLSNLAVRLRDLFECVYRPYQWKHLNVSHIG